jgi:putative transposase
LAGKKTGPNPTDRGKSGTKRSLLTDGNGVPIALAVAGANAHDKTLVKETLDHQSVHPQPSEVVLQRMCMDKGYDYDDVRQVVIACGYEPHILSRGEERKKAIRHPRYRARRWVCERTHSWMNRFRRILIRWEKKVVNYEAMLHLACAYICYSAAGVLG